MGSLPAPLPSPCLTCALGSPGCQEEEESRESLDSLVWGVSASQLCPVSPHPVGLDLPCPVRVRWTPMSPSSWATATAGLVFWVLLVCFSVFFSTKAVH